MGKAGRVVVGLGIVTLGVCAALPFQRREVVLRAPSAGMTPASGGLQVRGLDVPTASLERLPVLAMESSTGTDGATPALAAGKGPASSSSSWTVESGVAQPITPKLRLDHPSSAVPRIAESFSEANSVTLRPATGPVRLGAPVAWSADTRDANEPSTGTAASSQQEIRHRIRDGDTLPDLARRYLGDAGRASEIFEANRQALSRPDVLPLGQVLRIPAGKPDSPASAGG